MNDLEKQLNQYRKIDEKNNLLSDNRVAYIKERNKREKLRKEVEKYKRSMSILGITDESFDDVRERKVKKRGRRI